MVVTEAPSVHRATEHICKLYQRFYTQTIYPKVIRSLYATSPSLYVPSTPPWHCVYLRPLRVSVCPLYKPFSYHSIFRKNLLLPCYHVFYYPVTVSLITLYHVLNTLLPCLTLPCYHVFHYPVSIKECKTTKKSWQVNYPKEPYSSKQLTCQLVYLFTRLLKRLVYLKFLKPFIISSSWTQQA